MTSRFEFPERAVIGALHLPALPGTATNQLPIDEIVGFAVSNASVFEEGGVDGLYIQNAGDPVGPLRAGPDSVAMMAVVTRAVREHCSLPVGVTLAAHDAASSLAVATAAGASFVRLKVYVGAMVKAEGIIQGCAAEALAERKRLHAEGIAIVADVHDRTGVSLSNDDVELAADWACRMAKADALVVTGRSPEESARLLDRVKASGCGCRLLCGGSATEDNVASLLEHGDGVIVSTAFRAASGDRSRPWDVDRIKRLVRRAHAAPGTSG